MFSPFEHSSNLISNLSTTINSRPSSLLIHSDQLYIGTQAGSLYIYSIKTTNQATLSKSFNNLLANSNPIDSLCLIKEINSLAILSAGNITLHELNQLKLQSNCQRWTKSQASSIYLQTNILRQNDDQQLIQTTPTEDQTHIPVLLSILAVPCKRRLLLFFWKDGQWIDPKEINLPHQVRSLTFATPLNLFLGYSTGDYATIKLTIPSNTQQPITHQISDPFPSPIANLINNRSLSNDSVSPIAVSNSSPKVSGLSSLAFKTTGLVSLGLAGSHKVARNSVLRLGPPTDELIGIKEQIATFLNPQGKLTRPQTVHSGPSTIPSSILYPIPPSETIVRSPYLLSLLPTSSTSTSLFVHSIPTLSHLQTLPLPDQTTQESESKSSLPSTTQTSSPGKKPSLEPPFSSRPPNRQLLTASPNSGPIFLIGSQWNPIENNFQYQLECLQMKPWPDQIQQLIELGEYEEALGLMEGLDETHLPNKAQLLKKLNALCGVIDFSKYKYDRAIDTFISLSINPAKVVALYPPEISGSLGKKREEWEELFGGRSAESYRSNPLVGPRPASELVYPPHLSRAGSDIGSIPRSISHLGNNPNVVDDDRRSILSGPSAAPTKPKMGEPSLQRTVLEEKSPEDLHLRPSVEVLIRYLTDRRQQVNRALAAIQERPESAEVTDRPGTSPSDNIQPSVELEDRPIAEIESLEQLVHVAKVIDTALFKSYLALRPTMLGPLCRLPNWCEVELVEGLLMEAKRYHELLDLYHGKGQHAKALKLLKKMAMNEEDAMTQIEPTVRYLQKLGSKHIDVILESSKWVFSLCQDQEEEGGPGSAMELIKAGLEIFVADLSAVDSLPKPLIVTFLDHLKSSTPIQLYLEFIVRSLRLQDSSFHEKLIQIYLLEVNRLRGLGSLESGQEIYKKLLDHLEDSSSYSPNWVLGRLPPDSMWEARAITLGKIGQHETALRIYVERLNDIRLAEEYCQRVYEKNGAVDGSVFLCLLKICLRPNVSIVDKQSEDEDDEEESEKEEEEEEDKSGEQQLPEEEKQQEEENESEEKMNEELKKRRKGRPRLTSKELLESGIKMINEHGHKVVEIEAIVELIPPLVQLNRLDQFLIHALDHLHTSIQLQLVLRNSLLSRRASLAMAAQVLANRRVKIDLKRLCIGCGKRLGNTVIAVHPPFGEVTHYQCQDRYNNPHLRRL
ncbi:Vacuolar morphoproteinsis protein 6 [Puccinia graminis f. sp. tritici]|uniref:Vacuolar morphoproteinsis protein 6 n=1 Tax=Puccinia graminis f. sp. tritici TaxID=56615 RepID=A0A5B0PZX7_PUCGR|nr:Vacuolar morphoproteinsis protein 6 [Puccinia graminis f. sp. tritici]KAA1109399.1 Vacuolar morphoproteinsis protein 6 [Puccinia graminis f. sp. tritici]